MPQTTPHTLTRNAPHFRSGAVARLAGMPVSTLRIWEQRYQAVGPHTSPTGHRLYSSEDVERVVVLRQLTAHGHAIGSLAGLDLAQLQQLWAMAQASPGGLSIKPGPASDAAFEPTPLRLVVVGRAMAQRLQRMPLHQPSGVALQVVAVFDSLEQAHVQAHEHPREPGEDSATTPASAAPAHSGPVDVLLWQTAGLQTGQWPLLAATQQAWQARSVAVAYRFSGEAAHESLARAGAVLAREPESDADLADWLAALAPPAPAGGTIENTRVNAADPQAWLPPALFASSAAAPARRFDDATVASFGALSSGVLCDCPRHVADLLTQMSAFEAYSADCQHNSPADAELHAYLLRVAGAARVLFETALERVATTEGWPLPTAAAAQPI